MVAVCVRDADADLRGKRQIRKDERGREEGWTETEKKRLREIERLKEKAGSKSEGNRGTEEGKRKIEMHVDIDSGELEYNCQRLFGQEAT